MTRKSRKQTRKSRSSQSRHRHRGEDPASAQPLTLRGRKLVGAVLNLAERLAVDFTRDNPTWLVVDEHGRELARNMAWINGATPDLAYVEILSASAEEPTAAAMAVLRVDDERLRVLAWDLAGEARAVSHPIFVGEEISDWRRGWVEQFDDTPRGQERTRSLTSREEAEADIHHLAAVALDAFEHEVLPGRDRAVDVPAIIGTYEDGRIVIDPAPVEPLATDCGIGEVLARTRRAMSSARHLKGISLFRWHTIEDLRPRQHQFLLAGFDQCDEIAIAYALRVSEGDAGLALDEVNPVSKGLLNTWLIEGENRLEALPENGDGDD
ncbi:MAG: hypothetical protein QOI31_1737 [Solirubrobacterales bacterium]|jgi:hypothetical protein|nr:hypothetical protein [Solirubrobacterales bacterium]